MDPESCRAVPFNLQFAKIQDMNYLSFGVLFCDRMLDKLRPSASHGNLSRIFVPSKLSRSLRLQA